MSTEIMQFRTQAGQTMAEYAVVLGLITIAIVATLSLLSTSINDAFIRTLEVVQSAF